MNTMFIRILMLSYLIPCFGQDDHATRRVSSCCQDFIESFKECLGYASTSSDHHPVQSHNTYPIDRVIRNDEPRVTQAEQASRANSSPIVRFIDAVEQIGSLMNIPAVESYERGQLSSDSNRWSDFSNKQLTPVELMYQSNMVATIQNPLQSDNRQQIENPLHNVQVVDSKTTTNFSVAPSSSIVTPHDDTITPIVEPDDALELMRII